MFDNNITFLYFFDANEKEHLQRLFPHLTDEVIASEYSRIRHIPVVIKNGEIIDPKSKENIIKQKEEFKKRFCFVYENAKELIEFACPINNHLGFNFMKWLEILLLGNTPLEETYLYKKFTEEKQSEEELLEYITMKVHHTIWNHARVIGDKSKDMWELLSHLVYYISSRKNENSYNNRKELEALDEYFRVLRYSNDGIEWESGYELKGADLMHSLFLLGRESEEKVNYYDNPEFEGNEFLSCFASDPIDKDSIHLTEKEKQELYLKYHDELPWDFIVSCRENEKIALPSVCTPCDNSVLVLENNIFIDDDTNFYCMCDKCGYIIAIQKERIGSLVQNRIIDRCRLKKDLFRKMIIYSELQALDRDDGIKVLEKKKEDSEEIKYSYILSKFKNKRGN